MRPYEQYGAAGQYGDRQDQRWSYGNGRQQASLLAAVKGAIAGLAGTAILSVGLQAGPKLMEPAGTLFGGLIGGLASTVVPAMNLTPPPTEQPMAMNLFMGGINMVYGEGESVAVVYDMLG